MILGAEIGLLVYGIIVLIRGQYSLGQGRKVMGPKARVLGGICLAPLPLSLIAGFLVGTFGYTLPAEQFKTLIIGVEVSILAAAVIALIVLAKNFYRQQESASQAA